MPAQRFIANLGEMSAQAFENHKLAFKASRESKSLVLPDAPAWKARALANPAYRDVAVALETRRSSKLSALPRLRRSTRSSARSSKHGARQSSRRSCTGSSPSERWRSGRPRSSVRQPFSAAWRPARHGRPRGGFHARRCPSCGVSTRRASTTPASTTCSGDSMPSPPRRRTTTRARTAAPRPSRPRSAPASRRDLPRSEPSSRCHDPPTAAAAARNRHNRRKSRNYESLTFDVVKMRKKDGRRVLSDGRPLALAATYSPTGSPLQYHRRWRA